MSVTPFSATGRRKNAVARVSLTPGSGQVLVNRRPLEDYFPTASQQSQLLAPLRLTGTAQSL